MVFLKQSFCFLLWFIAWAILIIFYIDSKDVEKVKILKNLFLTLISTRLKNGCQATVSLILLKNIFQESFPQHLLIQLNQGKKKTPQLILSPKCQIFHSHTGGTMAKAKEWR